MNVSIIIPVYNSAKYLSECLDSIIQQSYADIEIICVNDGSKDNSLDILNEYADKDARIKIFTKENEGKGAASARNTGLDNATGDYVLFLDSDDFFELDMIESIVEKISLEDSDVIIFSADRYDDKCKKIVGTYDKINISLAPDLSSFNYTDCPEIIYQIGDLTAWNKVFKRSLLLEHNLYFEPISISDDQYIPALAILYATRISCIDRTFVHYRFNTGSSQCDSSTSHPEAAYAAVYSIVDRMREMNVYDVVKRSYLNMAVRLMREYFDKMDSVEKAKFLYDKYINEIFPFLEMEKLPDNYFYDDRLNSWYKLIISISFDEILFMTARAYGSSMTTGILRFQLPYEKISRGDRIVLVGKGLVGRYWYSQLLLSNFAEVVWWADNENDIPYDLNYDKVLIEK